MKEQKYFLCVHLHKHVFRKHTTHCSYGCTNIVSSASCIVMHSDDRADFDLCKEFEVCLFIGANMFPLWISKPMLCVYFTVSLLACGICFWSVCLYFRRTWELQLHCALVYSGKCGVKITLLVTALKWTSELNKQKQCVLSTVCKLSESCQKTNLFTISVQQMSGACKITS